MELKDRILKIMTLERQTASVFADSIGVQRSSISHIISGRNKPSLEFIQKVLTSYPKYNTEWVIMGLGEPIKELNTYKTNTEPNNNSLFSDTEKTETEPLNTPIQSNDNIPNKSVNPSEINSKTEPEIPKQPVDKNKTVDHIVIFYTDKTFTSYSPNN